MRKIDEQLDLLRRGRISRREFLSTTLALGLALPATTALAGKALAAEPKRGGRVRLGLGLGSTTDTLDPATYNDTYMQVVGFGFRNCLTEVSNEDELIPELAKSWEASDDATQWTFKLRKGVEFHSGKTLDAEDVIASVADRRDEGGRQRDRRLQAERGQRGLPRPLERLSHRHLPGQGRGSGLAVGRRDRRLHA
jgi:peptide/nickel transport system substrate-binding protein